MGASPVLTYDAFGNREEAFGHTASETTSLNHLYVGEQYDADANLYHLRARDYDPAIGRMTGMDAFEGAQKVPLSLNKYIYANSDPVNKIDPSGYFTMGGMMSGLNSAMNIYSMISSIWSIFDPESADPDSERFGLFDALLAGMVKSVISCADLDFSIPAIGAMVGSVGATTPHHTVPIYMCGADRKSNLANIPRPEHRKLHGILDGVTKSINIAGKAIELSFRRGGPKQVLLGRPIMTRFARTTQGRAAISASLGAFYSANGYLGLNDGRGGATLGAVFALESPQYIASRAATSWPKCKR